MPNRINLESHEDWFNRQVLKGPPAPTYDDIMRNQSMPALEYERLLEQRMSSGPREQAKPLEGLLDDGPQPTLHDDYKPKPGLQPAPDAPRPVRSVLRKPPPPVPPPDFPQTKRGWRDAYRRGDAI